MNDKYPDSSHEDEDAMKPSTPKMRRRSLCNSAFWKAGDLICSWSMSQLEQSCVKVAEKHDYRSRLHPVFVV